MDPTKVGEFYKGLRHEGYLYPASVCQWFSVAIGRDLLLLHSSMDRRMSLDPKRHIHMRDGDLRKTFTTDAAFHLVNINSVDELR